MPPVIKEILRYVAIGLGFGIIWAAMQYLNGQIRDIPTLIGPVIVFGLAGVLMWGLRRAVKALRGR